MSFIICGPAQGKIKKYACICCHVESDNIEDFAVSMCWECGLSADGKEGCVSCAEMREAEKRMESHEMICVECRNDDHDSCKGGTWCDCQHKSGNLINTGTNSNK